MSYLPSLINALFIHVIMIILLMQMPKSTTSPKRFQEKSVVICPKPQLDVSNQAPKPSTTAPKPAIKTPKIEMPQREQHKQKRSVSTRDQLKNLAEQLKQHITSGAECSWEIDQPISQEDSLRTLLETYLALPFSGEVRLTLTIDAQGSIKECCLLTELCAADRAWIFNRLHTIPFQKFFETYKISHEVTLHIKLRSD